MFSLPIYTGNLVQLQFPLTKTCYFHYHNFGTLIISRFDEFPHEVVIMLFFYYVHKEKKKRRVLKAPILLVYVFRFRGS